MDVRVSIVFSLLCLACDPTQCVKYKRIVEIGACDRFGACGVLFDDGTSSHGGTYDSSYPVIGKKVCAEHGKRKG